MNLPYQYLYMYTYSMKLRFNDIAYIQRTSSVLNLSRFYFTFSDIQNIEPEECEYNIASQFVF